MVNYDRSLIPGSIAVGGHTWDRKYENVREGVFQWVRPLHLDEREYNRHDIQIEGRGDYPTAVVELRQQGTSWHITSTKTAGPDSTRTGMDGVYDSDSATELEDAVEIVREFIRDLSDDQN